MVRHRYWIIWISLLTLLWVSQGGATAQSGVDHWLRYDVTLKLQQNSGLAVEEIHEVALVSGATTFERVIPSYKLESISNLQILQQDSNGGQRTYQPTNTKAEYTFEVTATPDQQTVRLYFPPNNTSSTIFILRYFVTGALRFYDTGDRLDWQPLGESTAAPIARSTTTINLPAPFTDEQIIRSSTGAATNIFLQSADKVTFVAADIAPNSKLEVSVTFPHGAVQGAPPGWQREIDKLEYWTPKLQWGSIILGLLILLVGPLLVYGWWYLRIRVSPGPGKFPNRVKTLPDKLPPAEVGALLDGHANPKHILAALLDLAYRGALNIDSGNKPKSASPKEQKPAFNLYAVDQNKVAQSYEVTLYGKIFGSGGVKRDLAEMHEALFMSTPELKRQIDAAIAQAGYFESGYRVKRRQYIAFGGAGVVMSLLLALLVSMFLQQYTYLVACPFLGLAAAAATLIAAGWAVPTKTKAGVKEAVPWEAFKRFLSDMSLKEAEKYKLQFAHWLPYAVTFGIEKDFVKKFAAANAPRPKWWGQPKEKSLNVGLDQAYVWVSASVVEAESQQKAAQAHSKSPIRRLGQSNGEIAGEGLLKSIQSALIAFLKDGCETFSKAPVLDESKGADTEEI
ncbi:MAG: DUF2207 domain-containing protein [Anaerolineales bacterium]|nr:DUF2207 domain-containing protein [Anaerolineales bacterium]